MKVLLIATGLALALAAPARAVTVSWVDWDDESPCTATGCTRSGSVNVGGNAADMVYTTTNNTFRVTNDGSAGETDFWDSHGAGGFPTPVPAGAGSPYTSTGPLGNDNRPTGTGMTGLVQAGTHTITFSAPVTNLYFAFLSLNNNTMTFSRQIQLLSSAGENIDGDGVDACGYWGCGTAEVTDFSITGGPGRDEVSGVLVMTGTFSSFTFSSGFEDWHGFTLGVAGIGPGTPSEVPVPASAALLLLALGGLGAVARRRV